MNKKIKEGDGVLPYMSDNFGGDKVYNQVTSTIKANKVDVGAVVKEPELKIRKLTPLECLKLQGFSEEDYKAISKRFGNSAIYHVAGDSISVSTLMCGVFGTMTNIDYRKATQDYVETLKGDYE